MFRYSDLSAISPSSADFVRRKRHGSVLVAFLIYFSLLLVLVGYGFYKNYHNKDVILIILLTVGISTLILHALYSIQKSLDMIMAVEFQNALFTSALNLRMDFTIIMQRNGSIVYVDRGFRDMFPEIRAIDDKVLDYLVTNMRLDDRAKDKFFLALRNYDFEQLVAEVYRGDGELDRYMLYMSPIPRPQGYFMIQARKYVEVRNAANVNMAPLTFDAADIVHPLLDAMPGGAYMLTEQGEVLDCNDALLEMLGYENFDDLFAQSPKLESLTKQSNFLIKAWQPQSFNGRIELKCKNGETMLVGISQNTILQDGKVTGALGLVSKLA
jgi:PAS domain-containing protein